jgi:transposase
MRNPVKFIPNEAPYPVADFCRLSTKEMYQHPIARLSMGYQLENRPTCELSVEIGLFFDGTNNNMIRDRPSNSHSNIVRLHDAFRDEDLLTSCFKHYIPEGVAKGPCFDRIALPCKLVDLMKAKRIKRRVLSIDTSNQFSLLMELPPPAAPKLASLPPMQFEAPDPQAIFINQVRLDDHLKRMGETAPLKVRAFIQALSFADFESVYRPGGRPPYAPRAMVGLILYGIMQGVSSLRGLERLAKIDAGCWWVTGGIVPDHSIIGRFIDRHAALLTEAFFTQLTKKVLGVTRTTTTVVAGDGTVIEAAASRYRLVRQEALQEALMAACAQAVEIGDPASEDKVAQLEHAARVLSDRQAERAARGKDGKTLSIQPLEPEAVVQPQKDKNQFRASYKPQVLANEARIIVACDVHPSSETVPIEGLLDQASKHGEIETGLFDAGYFNETVANATAARQIEMLCPEGRSEGKNWEKTSTKTYLKNQFTYDAEHDHYRCPAHQVLMPIARYQGNATNPAYVKYGGAPCADCGRRARCTTSKNGREIKRYAIDTAKDRLRAKMKLPAVRAWYSKRKAMVEPVFSHLRGQQGLNRFRRSGLTAVRLEFALHAMAHNLSRMVALCRLFYTLYMLLWTAIVRRMLIARTNRDIASANAHAAI